MKGLMLKRAAFGVVAEVLCMRVPLLPMAATMRSEDVERTN